MNDKFGHELAMRHGIDADDVAEMMHRIGRILTVRHVHILGIVGAVIAERHAEPHTLARIPEIASEIGKHLGVTL